MHGKPLKTRDGCAVHRRAGLAPMRAGKQLYRKMKLSSETEHGNPYARSYAMKKMKNCWLVCVVVALVVAFAGADRSLAAEPVDLAGTDWSMPGTVKGSVSRLGKVPTYAALNLEFDDADSFDLEISLGDGDFLELSGDYSANPKGKVTITEDDIDQATLDTLMETIADIVVDEESPGLDYTILGISDYKVKITAKPKRMTDKKNDNQETIKLSVSGKVSAKANVDVEGEEVTVKISLSFKGIGYRNDFAIAASNWEIPSKYSFSVRGLEIKDKETPTIDLALGAKAEGDDVAHFTLTDANDGESFSGTYTTHKNKYIFYPDIEELEDYLGDKVGTEVVFDDGGRFELDEADLLKKYRVTGSLKTKHGVQTMSFKLAVTFEVDGIEYDDDDIGAGEEYKGSLKISGKGGTSP